MAFWNRGKATDSKPPAPKKTSEAEIGVWAKRIEDAIRWRREEWDDRAEESMKFYRGRQWDAITADDADLQDQIVANLTQSTVLVKVANLRVANPQVRARPKRGEQDEQGSRVAQALCGYLWGELDLGEDLEHVVLDALCTGIGVFKLGYQYERVKDELTRQKFNEKTEEFETKVQGDSSDGMMEEPVLERPWAVRIDPRDFYVEPGSTNLRDASWTVHKSRVLLNEVQANEQYDKKNRMQVQSSSGEFDEPTLESTEREINWDETKTAYVWLYEIWDRKGQKVVTVAKGGTEGYLQLRTIDWPFDMEGYPFVVLRLIQDPQKFFGISMVDVCKEINRTYNLLLSLMMRHIRRFSGVTLLTKEGAMDKENQTKFMRAQTGGVVTYKENYNASEAMFPLPNPPALPDIPNMLRYLEHVFEIITGVSQYQRAGVSPGVRSATEAEMLDRWSYARVSVERAQVKKFATTVLRKLLQISRQYYDAQFLLEATGDPVEEVRYSRDQIQGEYDVDILFSEGAEQTPDQEVKQKMMLVQVMSQIAPALNQFPFLRKPFIELLRALGVEKPDEYKFDQVNPQMMQMQQMMGAAGGNGNGGGGMPAPSGISAGMQGTATKPPMDRGGRGLL